jgi:Ca2+-binding RTX toxin-like protein
MAVMTGTKGSDVGSKAVVGTNDSDALYGLDGNDDLHGRWSADVLDGGKGNDKLWGDAGDDTLTGGRGGDEFIFGWDMGNDVITDFNAARNDTDTIELFDYHIEGQWFHTNYEWMAPTDVNNDGQLDAVLHLYSSDWVEYVNEGKWARYNDDPSAFGGSYDKNDMHDTVTLLGWGGDLVANADGGWESTHIVVNNNHEEGYMFV